MSQSWISSKPYLQDVLYSYCYFINHSVNLLFPFFADNEQLQNFDGGNIWTFKAIVINLLVGSFRLSPSRGIYFQPMAFSTLCWISFLANNFTGRSMALISTRPKTAKEKWSKELHFLCITRAIVLELFRSLTWKLARRVTTEWQKLTMLLYGVCEQQMLCYIPFISRIFQFQSILKYFSATFSCLNQNHHASGKCDQFTWLDFASEYN